MTDDPIEIMARAFCCVKKCERPKACDSVAYNDTGRFYLAALESRGYRLAQREPTKEMVRAISAYSGIRDKCQGYRLLWDALPKHGGGG